MRNLKKNCLQSLKRQNTLFAITLISYVFKQFVFDVHVDIR